MTDLPAPPLANAGINQVQVLIQRLTSNTTTYWNGSVWQAGAVWNQASTPTAGTWVYNSSGVPWVHGTSYLVVSQSSDNAGNVENSFSVSANSNTFTFDVQAPTAALTTPAYIDAAVTSLSGTALDAPAGVASLSVALSSAGGAGGWWNGSSFNGAAPVYFATSSYVYGPPDAWTVPLATSSLVNDVSYLAQSQASDRAGNSRVQVLGSFTFNNQAPTAVIQAPANNDYYNSLPTISGASTGNVGISTIALSVQDADTGQCYAPGSGFSAGCPNYFAAGGTPGAWSYGGIAWSDGNDYVVTARATDVAGNVQSSFALGTSSVAFEFDATAPGIGFTNPDAPRENNLTSLSGTASDEDGGPALAVVQVRVQRLTGIEYYLTPGTLQFDGNTPNPDNAWINASYTLNWTSWYLSSGIPWVSGEQYLVMARSIDLAGNYSVPYASYTVVFDNTPPQTQVAFPANGSAIDALPTISGTMSDVPGDGQNPGLVTSVGLQLTRLSDGECWDGASWRNSGCPQTMGAPAGVQVWTTSWTVASGNLPTLTTGTSYYISSSGTDNTSPSGNVEGFGSVRGSTFTFDSTPPLSRIQAPVNGAFYNSLNTLSGTMTDLPAPPLVNAGINQVQVLIQRLTSDATTYWNGSVWQAGAVWNQASTPTAGTWNYNSSAVPWVHGTSYLVVSQSSDNAGNMRRTRSRSRPTPTPSPSTCSRRPESGQFHLRQPVSGGGDRSSGERGV